MTRQTDLRQDSSGHTNWRGLAAAIATISVVGMAIGLGIPLLSFILDSRGVSAGMIGMNTAVAGLASLAAAPFATPLAVRFGIVPVILVMLGVGAVSFTGFYVFPGLEAWFMLRAILHFALTVLFILSEAWVNHSAPPERRGFVLGIYATVLSLGFAAGPWLFSQIGSQGFTPFGTILVLIVGACIPVLLAHRESPDLGQEGDSGPGAGLFSYILLVPTATAAVLVYGAVETGGFALFPVFGVKYGHSETDAALLLTMIGLGNVLLQIPLGFLSDKIGDRRILLAICAAVGLAGMLVLPSIADDWRLTAAVLFVWGGVVAGLYTVGLAHLGSQLQGRDLVAANAAFVFCYALGMLAGPWAIGIGMDKTGPAGFAHVLSGFFIPYLALVVWRILAAPRK